MGGRHYVKSLRPYLNVVTVDALIVLSIYITGYCAAQVILLHMVHAHLTGYLLMLLVVDLVVAHNFSAL
jgi:hypothetical protein